MRAHREQVERRSPHEVHLWFLRPIPQQTSDQNNVSAIPDRLCQEILTCKGVLRRRTARLACCSHLLVEPWSVATNAENIRARDAKVIAAAWRLIASTGVASLTVKALAAEAGVAPSSMLYTMPSHAVVRERALQAIAPRIRDRVSVLPVNLDGGPEKARALLSSLLPLDAERRLEASVLLALSACALNEPGLQPIWREVDGTVRDVCAQALRVVGVRGDVVALDHLHTLMHGLIAQLMNRGEGRSPQWALAVLDRELLRYGG